MLEKELKYELNRRNYQKLQRSLRDKRSQRFELASYYFDSPDLGLRKKRFALRVRIVDGKRAYFTLKYPAKRPPRAPYAFKVRFEHEVEIPLRMATLLLSKGRKITGIRAKPVRILHRHFPVSMLDRVEPLGVMRTVRTVVPVNKKWKLEIDRYWIYKRRFYEVEIETHQPREADRAIRLLFERVGIPYAPSRQSKFSRFLDEWKEHHPGRE